MKAKPVLASALILVLVAGVIIGFALGNKYRAQNLVGSTHSERTDRTHESSLREYLALLNILQAGDASEAARRVHAEDQALLLLRLADVAEQRGSSAESTRLTSDALAVCATAGLPYCSSVELRQRAHKLEMIPESGKRSG